MEQVNYANGWVRTGNVFAYPYDWQQPAKTELWAYEKLLQKACNDTYTQYICFPWATLVDYLDYNPEKAAELLNAIERKPPVFALNVKTFCQHIYALKLLPFFKKLGITEIYWSHKIKGQDEIEGIKLKPYPLYPVMHYKRKRPYENKPLSERKYLYSFIGSYQPELYLTKVREWIFNLGNKSVAYIRKRREWHFEQDVYLRQVKGLSESEAERLIRQKNELEYISVMEDSIFSLCPSGAGPNSIRLWESLEFGCIPVLFGGELELDHSFVQNLNNRIVVLEEKEQSVKSLDSKLKSIYQRYLEEIN